jgi:hypothetical protein
LNPPNIQRLELALDPSKEEERQKQKEEAIHNYEESFGNMKLEKSYEPLFEMLWYSQLPCTDIKGVTSEVQDELSFIKKCYWKEREMNCNEVFQKRPTNHGMCCSFNMKKAEDILRKSRYQEAIALRQSEDRKHGFKNDWNTQWFNGSNELKAESGFERGLKVIFDGHSNRLSLASVSADFEGFQISVEDNKNFPIMGGYIVRPGLQNNIQLDAVRLEGREEIRKYQPEQRNCYFPDEHHLKLHRNYSYSNCIFECKLEFAAKCLTICNDTEHHCDCQDYKAIDAIDLKSSNACVPWYYPSNQSEIKTICDPWDSVKFIEILNKKIPSEQCEKCLPDCSITKYESSMAYAKLQKCDGTTIGSSSILCDIMDKTINPAPWVSLAQNEYITSNLTIPGYLVTDPSKKWINTTQFSNTRTRFPTGNVDDTEMFSSAARKHPTYDAFEKDIGIVNVFFARPVLSKYITSNKMSTADFASAIGGSLGGILGLSYISVVEMAYWLVVCILKFYK